MPHSEIILEIRMLPVRDELGNERHASLSVGCVVKAWTILCFDSFIPVSNVNHIPLFFIVRPSIRAWLGLPFAVSRDKT